MIDKISNTSTGSIGYLHLFFGSLASGFVTGISNSNIPLNFNLFIPLNITIRTIGSKMVDDSSQHSIRNRMDFAVPINTSVAHFFGAYLAESCSGLVKSNFNVIHR